jgi:flagellar hook-associated protein 1 FlgK
MAIPNIINTGRSGLVAAKAAIATTGHNITNANTEGFSRQRVQTEVAEPRGGQWGKNTIGTGTKISRIERINDEYIEKQIRNANRELSHFEEKDMSLRQIEDIFNEMNGDGLNRLISRFFNEFRKLSDEPESLAVRESVREATKAMVNDFHRLRREVDEVRRHLDSKVEGYSSEVNSYVSQVADLNKKIRALEPTGGPPNDLLDQRDVALKKLGSYLDITAHKDNHGNFNVDIRGVGPLIAGGESEHLYVERTSADSQGKPEQAFDVKTSGSVPGTITHQIKGGKLGAVMEVRDKTISTILSRLDEMAYTISASVNEIHKQGYTPSGVKDILFFKPMAQKERAAEFLSLSDEIQDSIDNIATAAIPEAPGDNRIAIAISRLQNQKMMNNGYSSADEWYNSIVSDVGVATSKNRFVLNQQKDIMNQLNKVRDQISGVSIDEETTNLLQFQHAFDASAKVIQVADELLKTVLALKRD